MGTWFRDYVYIPLGGNKGGLAKRLRVVQGHVSGVLFGRGSLYLLLTYGGMLLLCTIAATPLRKACYEKLNARLGQRALTFADCGGLACVLAASMA